MENTNSLAKGLVQQSRYIDTENGGVGLSTTGSKLYDFFAMAPSMRNRSSEDLIQVFSDAYHENPEYALRCLFYLRDCRAGTYENQYGEKIIVGGCGERDAARILLHWLACYDPNVVRENLSNIPLFGRYDDMFCLVDTPLESEMWEHINQQLKWDVFAMRIEQPISLCAKWMPSINTSSKETRALAHKAAHALGLNDKEYRQLLSKLRAYLKVIEVLMSSNQWDKIDFERVPAGAGLKYRHCFANREETAKRYEDYINDDNTKVHADTLYPYEVVRKLREMVAPKWDYRQHCYLLPDPTNIERLALNRYWENLRNVVTGETQQVLCVVDTSGSMTDAREGQVAPIDIAISLGMYAAEHMSGPWHNKFITFSEKARLVEIEGIDFCDKATRIMNNCINENTNLQSVFQLLEDTIIQYKVKPEEIPALCIITDQEIDNAVQTTFFDTNLNPFRRGYHTVPVETTMETIQKEWDERLGGAYKFPKIYFWNANSRGRNLILDEPSLNMTYVAGASQNLFNSILRGISGEDLMWEILTSPRYADVVFDDAYYNYV